MRFLVNPYGRRAAFFASTSLLVFFLSASATIGQTPTGSISGLVKDESGAVIPGASVVVTNVGTGVRRSVPSNSAGRYRAPGLDAGSYQVEAQASGFQTTVRSGIQLTVGRAIEIEMLLRLGQVEQVTEVTAEAPLVETVTNTLSGLVDQQTIRELPLNGRSLDQLLVLEPGVHWFRSVSHNAHSGSSGEMFSVGGSKAHSNLFLLDGSEMLGAGTHSLSPGSVLGKSFGVDAIQEFTVLTANYSAAYGKRNGGVVNMITRPGTNQFHGSGYEFLRNDDLDARNFFDPTPQPAEFRRNQFGGSIGGPVRQDKTFFFATYEGLREALGETNIAVVPDNNARQGLIPDPANPGQLRNVGVAPQVRPYIPILFGEPNGRNFGDGTAEHIAAPSRVGRQDFVLGRIDHHFSEKDSLFGRYNFQDNLLFDPDAGSLTARSSTNRTQMLTLEEKRSYPTTLNIARFAFLRTSTITDPNFITPSPASLYFVQGADRVGQVLFGSGQTQAGESLTQAGANRRIRWVVNQFEFSDQVFLYFGRHSLQIGSKFQRIQENDEAPNEGLNGQFEFSGVESFLTGKPVRFQGVGPGSDPFKSYRRSYFDAFVQDDFKMFPNFTLNLGVRYELMSVPTEKYDRISNFRRRLIDGVWVVDTNPTLGSPFWEGDHNLFAPRVGFAWDLFSDGKTVFRGGFGTFHDQIIREFTSYTTLTNIPFNNALHVPDAPFPLGFSGAIGAAPVPLNDVIQFNLDLPTKLQWNFSVQRQIAANAVLQVAYVGSRGYHLTKEQDSNTPAPQILPGGGKFYPAGAERRNPALGLNATLTTDANSYYQSLQFDYTQRVTQGLRAKATYTLSKNIDEDSGLNARGNPSTSQDPFDRRAERALSSFDSRHTVTTNFTYDLPGSNLSGMAGKVIGGWQLSSIISANSGEPLTVQSGLNRSRDQQTVRADRPNLRAGANNNPVLGGPDKYFDPNVFELPPVGFYGNLGRNTLIGPGYVGVDMSLVKITPVGERFNTEFRAEFFNLLNRANFSYPRLAAFGSNGRVSGSAGRISATSTTSRQIQFGIKLSF